VFYIRALYKFACTHTQNPITNSREGGRWNTAERERERERERSRETNIISTGEEEERCRQIIPLRRSYRVKRYKFCAGKILFLQMKWRKGLREEIID